MTDTWTTPGLAGQELETRPPVPVFEKPTDAGTAQAAGKALIRSLVELCEDAERRQKRVVGVRALRRILDDFKANAS